MVAGLQDVAVLLLAVAASFCYNHQALVNGMHLPFWLDDCGVLMTPS